MFEEAVRRDPKQTRKWVALVDGNETQLDLLKVAAHDYDVELEIILDWAHSPKVGTTPPMPMVARRPFVSTFPIVPPCSTAIPALENLAPGVWLADAT
jgi:hypothetical protein